MIEPVPAIHEEVGLGARLRADRHQLQVAGPARGGKRPGLGVDLRTRERALGAVLNQLRAIPVGSRLLLRGLELLRWPQRLLGARPVPHNLLPDRVLRLPEDG